ncbi:MAG: class I mannose-6-phosphate isomerase [Phycisphaerae bacterium]|nr:class I mannose-6-phosphate isomerase [Phycisphaerae bacterium]
MEIYPYKFKPIFKERIWGGSAIADIFGKNTPEGIKIGESWELADLPDDKSVIANGPLAGQNIAQAIEKYAESITGKPQYTPPLPLLIKILDASNVLSVQVHPDSDTCKKTGKGDPKTECWYIIDAKPGSCIYKGLKTGTTRDQFAAAIADGSCADLIEKVEAKVGDCHFLPSGTVHAIGAGLLIAEIQQPSDTTYRVFDWNRVGDDGKPRQLHVDDALESIHFDPSGDDLSVKSVGRLVDTEFFKIDKGHMLKDLEMLVSAGIMKVIVVLSGGGRIESQLAETVEFTKGDTVLLPAAYEGVVFFEGDTEYLTVTM